MFYGQPISVIGACIFPAERYQLKPDQITSIKGMLSVKSFRFKLVVPFIEL
jgi:hypothetical protein